MIIYMDGSAERIKNTKEAKEWILAWGMVVHQGDETHELSGVIEQVPHELQGFHEIAAFANAIMYVKKHKVPYEQVSFYTDDQFVTDANFFLHPENYVATETVDKVKNRLMMFVNEFYPSTMYDLMLECLRKSKFTKVKGHKMFEGAIVYNHRVDYLASHARRSKLGTVEPFLSFEAWLGKGISFFNVKKDAYDVWYPPFAQQTA